MSPSWTLMALLAWEFPFRDWIVLQAQEQWSRFFAFLKQIGSSV